MAVKIFIMNEWMNDAFILSFIVYCCSPKALYNHVGGGGGGGGGSLLNHHQCALCYKIFIFQINAVLLNFLFICESWKIKCITVSTKILCSTTVSNIDNNQSAYYYDFWRSCDTEDWSNDAENTDLITEIHFILTDIQIENSCFNF